MDEDGPYSWYLQHTPAPDARKLEDLRIWQNEQIYERSRKVYSPPLEPLGVGCQEKRAATAQRGPAKRRRT
ncbi:ABR158WAp [Eremothecium gossypii ATCC 10895]|uniref:ABR158WAp n=1 Tax=Eremothecium gossypii (strain ATCC 10895 / CBS 109.51 / FGSC 9923 / NRRL Y-1056) TaxID=284811 RepID=D8FGA7_EREGS|nr:ABR158WAp [Eremothecium gossypii ATCC 10895]ADJ41750.1 ABR158WAp [Eremothecium gossypii ATCC 10895]AEY95219.1 FABR158WAp [Eremothecium gossypii FDAG1]